MGAVLVSWVDQQEPITFADVAAQGRIVGVDDQSFVENVIIPAARQLAETRCGSAIRTGTYREIRREFPSGAFALAKGSVTEIVSVKCGGVLLDAATYTLTKFEPEAELSPVSSWPTGGPVEIEYKAGADLANFPSVKQWLLLACAWAYDNRELMATGQVSELPSGYADALLQPLTLLPRF